MMGYMKKRWQGHMSRETLTPHMRIKINGKEVVNTDNENSNKDEPDNDEHINEHDFDVTLEKEDDEYFQGSPGFTLEEFFDLQCPEDCRIKC